MGPDKVKDYPVASCAAPLLMCICYMFSCRTSLYRCTEMQQAEALLLEMGFCSHVHTKEMYLQQTVIDGGRPLRSIHNAVHAAPLRQQLRNNFVMEFGGGIGVTPCRRHAFASMCAYHALDMRCSALPGLASEQKALLDFLVLSKAELFVGFGASTFSFYLQQHRLLNGFPGTSSVMANASIITTDPLFEAAGIVFQKQ